MLINYKYCFFCLLDYLDFKGEMLRGWIQNQDLPYWPSLRSGPRLHTIFCWVGFLFSIIWILKEKCWEVEFNNVSWYREMSGILIYLWTGLKPFILVRRRVFATLIMYSAGWFKAIGLWKGFFTPIIFCWVCFLFSIIWILKEECWEVEINHVSLRSRLYTIFCWVHLLFSIICVLKEECWEVEFRIMPCLIDPPFGRVRGSTQYSVELVSSSRLFGF
jgi:hypothetical protein